jgi:hypothetical protein
MLLFEKSLTYYKNYFVICLKNQNALYVNLTIGYEHRFFSANRKKKYFTCKIETQ